MIIINSIKKLSFYVIVATLCNPYASASTVDQGANTFSVNEGVTFNIDNLGASDFRFTWTDPNPSATSFSDKIDPTLVLTLGQTYNFQRTSSSHPFVLMDNSAATLIELINGSYSRKSSTTGSQIAAAILKPVADFTAEPSPTNDLITWTPEAVGDFWYTCSVVGHTTMTGKISVVPEPSSFALIASAVAFALVCLRRR